ncbi:MAG: YicC/YloC family endoribonuclease [Bacteroidales bacterium]
MIKSMTGFGRSMAETREKKISVEIKSLNSKSLDLNIRLPWLYKEKESEIRNLVSQKLDRGKIDLTVSFDIIDSEIIPVINKNVVKSYFSHLKEISDELGIKAGEQLLSAVLRLPDALKTGNPDLAEDEWTLVREKIIDALQKLDEYRIEEGKSIEADMVRCTVKIGNLLNGIGQFEEERIRKIREKLNSALAENMGQDKIDNNRFEQEIIFYLEKLDINEEKVRLKKHCEYFLEKISSLPPNGKILNFISQEMGREINTIGSKANDASIQKLVVMMKDELEKIKEQTLNVL